MNVLRELTIVMLMLCALILKVVSHVLVTQDSKEMALRVLVSIEFWSLF